MSLPALRREQCFGTRVVRCFAQRDPDVLALFLKQVRTRPQADALIFEGRVWTYAQLDAESRRIAAGLSALGLQAGERLGLWVGNRPEFLLSLLGALRLGLIVVPLGVRLQKPEIAWILDHCEARALVHDAELSERLPETASLPHLKACFTEAPRADVAVPDHAPSPEDTAFILYTSGTTGRPKGAMLTHLNLVHSALHYLHAMDLGPEDRSLLVVPASHVTGLVAILLALWQCGGATVMAREFKAADTLTTLARERVTHTIMVPAMYSLCLLSPEFGQHDLSHWRIGGYGGAPMPQSTIATLAQRVPSLSLINAYGATETTSPVTLLPPALSAARPDSVGLALPCAEIAVMDPQGLEVPAGEPGELWIRGPMVVPGYWNNPEATESSFIAGFWRSGDIGSVDAEGFVRVFDRLKDMINRGGYKIFSVEVENVLVAHPAVLEAAVVGRPCPVLGERVHAVVSLREGAEEPSVDQLRAFCARELADYKVPETILMQRTPLPRNANGKLLKRELRQPA